MNSDMWMWYGYAFNAFWFVIAFCIWMYRRLFYDRGFSPLDRHLRRPRNSFADGYSYMDPGSYMYGPSRSTTYPWKRDNEMKKKPDSGSENSSTTPVIKAEESGALGSAAPAVDVEKHFHVLNVDLNILENTHTHHTNKYMCTKRKFNPVLVVRRGQSFVMTVHFDRPYDVVQHELHFSFRTGQFPSPPKRTSAIVTMNETSTGVADHYNWFVQLFSIKDKSINVEITPPCNCIIGEWMFSIHTECKLKDSAGHNKLEYNYNEDIVILLNPWCTEDQVFMTTEGLLDEYILNESGAIYGGNYHQISAKPWNFGQFEDGLLDICLHIVRKAFNNTVDPGMADAVKISRAISQIVNAQDDSGVLTGNWSGNYTDGTSPTQWVGSVAILREYAQNKGQSVKFGQCWVFSGVTTTVCRAIGLPARSITNFSSAHDKDGSTSIDHPYVNENGKWRKLRNKDSVWNFHVWNEAWISRKHDLGKGYDGWQVIDSTPQEMSEGQYRCGPCPVNAIKKGEIGRVNYDATFIFAEVNADIVDWQIKSNNQWVVLNTNTNHVGRNISTKKPDGQPYRGDLTMLQGYAETFREDVTHQYKHSEGTLEERVAVHSANKTAHIDRDVFTIKEKDLTLEIIDKDGIMVGNDFEVDIRVKNISKSQALRTITKLYVQVDSVKYTGEVVGHITVKEFENIYLGYQDEKLFKLPIKTANYLDHMFELFAMQILALAHVKETENVYIEEEDYRLRRPDIIVQGSTSPPRIGAHYEIRMSFKNPLPVALTNCSLMIEGNGVKNMSRAEKDVPAKTDWSSTAMLEPHVNGNVQVNVSFGCRELKDVTGLILITVAV